MERSSKTPLQPPYPQLSVGTGLLTAFILFSFSAFIIGIQAYVLVTYSQFYGEEIVTVSPEQRVTGGEAWGDAYNGTALAAASTCVLIGLYTFVTLHQRNRNLLRLGALLVVIGAAISAASSVVTGLACARINSAAIHPCSLKYANSDPTLFPDVDTCTTWFALEVTVSVLSGVNFCLCFVIFCVIIAGLSDDGSYNSNATSSATNQQMANGSATHDDQHTTEAKVRRALSDRRPMVGDPNWNTMYKRHLQQVIVQQKLRQQYHIPPPPPLPPTEANPAPRQQQEPQQQQRGKLQELHRNRLVRPSSSNASNHSSNYSDRPISDNKKPKVKEVKPIAAAVETKNKRHQPVIISPQQQQQIKYQQELEREMERRQRLRSSERY